MKKTLQLVLAVLISSTVNTAKAQALMAHGGGPFTECSGLGVVIGSNPTATGGTPGYTYSWSPATALSSTTAANPTASPTSNITYTLTVMDNVGGTATATAMVTVSQPPTVSNAGANQTVCGATATLAGNTAAIGTGLWTLVSGAGTVTTPTSPTSGITGLGGGANIFDWTISNAPCTASSSQVTITSIPPPTVANAGPNQTVFCTTATMAANVALVGTGVWTLVSGGGTITNPSSPTSGVTSLPSGPNVFQWTITNPPCAPSASQVTITNGCAGINEWTDGNSISIYPNPANGVFTIESTGSKMESVKVFDVLGCEILRYALNDKKATLDMGYNKGIYFLQITDSNKNVINKKIIIN